MAWDRNAPSNPKYRTVEHRRTRARWAAILKRDGAVQCAQPVCIMPTRTIHDGDDWHLGHNDAGDEYVGPVHAQCNVLDGSKRASARSHGKDTAPPSRWVL